MPIRFGIWLDFRNPRQWGRDPRRLWAETLELAADAESLGYDDVWTSEHHFVDDGYLSSSFAACAAIAARTSRVRIGTNVVLLPLHDPIRVAEDAATVDLISGGRFDLGVAVGYRTAEFDAFGFDARERGTRMEKAIARLSDAFGGRPIAPDAGTAVARGFTLAPRPLQVPMPLLVGAMSRAAALRAGRYGSGLLASELLAPSLETETTVDLVINTFKEEQSRRGLTELDIALGPGFGFVSPDPDREAPAVLPHLAYRRLLYQRWFEEAGVTGEPTAAAFDEATFRARYPWILVSPETARARVAAILARYPMTTRLYFWAVPPGLEIARARSSIELFAREVIPAFRDA